MEVNPSKKIPILYAVKTFREILGKKALQKVMYFANLDLDLYSFQWNRYGPYSEELNYLFEDAVVDELIEIDQQDLLIRNGTQWNMSLSGNGINLVESKKISPEVKRAVDLAYDFLSGKSPREMELLASVHFIVRSSRNSDAEYVSGIIDTLKPYSHFALGEVVASITELRRHNLL